MVFNKTKLQVDLFTDKQREDLFAFERFVCI